KHKDPSRGRSMIHRACKCAEHKKCQCNSCQDRVQPLDSVQHWMETDHEFVTPLAGLVAGAGGELRSHTLSRCRWCCRSGRIRISHSSRAESGGGQLGATTTWWRRQQQAAARVEVDRVC